ncbi:MAG: hypothetical protein PHC51_06950 [bacterium]|nr:hypothetical protein [bacterium]
MKTKILLMTGLILLTTATAQAQPFDRQEMLDRRIDRMQQRLNLSDEQANKVADILGKEMEQAPCKSVNDFTARKVCRDQHREAIDRKIAEVLDEKQVEAYRQMKEFRKSRREEMQGRQGQGGFPGGNFSRGGDYGGGQPQ